MCLPCVSFLTTDTECCNFRTVWSLKPCSIGQRLILMSISSHKFNLLQKLIIFKRLYLYLRQQNPFQAVKRSDHKSGLGSFLIVASPVLAFSDQK